MEIMKITPIQKAFCEEYVLTYNARRSMMKVRPDMSKEVADITAHRALKKPAVIEYIKRLQDEAIKEYGDINNLLIKELVEDVVKVNDNGEHSATWTKSADLLQKQLGLQKQNVKADVKADVDNNISITIGE